jgi:perosamine synthetase
LYSFDSNFRAVAEFMESARSFTDAQLRGIAIEDDNEIELGRLVGLASVHLGVSELASLSLPIDILSNLNQPAGQGNEGGTSAPLDFVNDRTQISFLIQGKSGGYLGWLQLNLQLACTIRFHFFLNGDLGIDTTFFSAAINALEEFVYQDLGAEVIEAQVGSSDLESIRNLSALGYSRDLPTSFEFRSHGNASPDIGGTSELMPSSLMLLSKKLTDSREPLPKILTAGPSISGREVTYVSDAARKGWNARHSEYLVKFQSDFAAYVGSVYAIPTSSCTGALHLSLLALGIGPGDEVIVPEITWVATASAVRYVGATPVFADVDPLTWCIDVRSAIALVTPKTKAIIPVHLYGFAANMHDVMELADQFGLHVVEDAAPAIGTLIGSKAAGTYGQFGAYSFQGAKMLVTGEGGMLVTSNEELYQRALKIQDHGRKPGTFWIDELGQKYKMNNVTAALGLAQLERSERQIEQKRRIAGWYQEGFDSSSAIRMQSESPGTRAIHWMNSVVLQEGAKISAKELMEILRDQGIDSRPLFPAISQYPIWEKRNPPGPVAKILGDTGVNLPSGVGLSRQSIERVVQAVLRAV